MDNKEEIPGVRLLNIDEVLFSLRGIPQSYIDKLMTGEEIINVDVDIAFIKSKGEERIGVKLSFIYSVNFEGEILNVLEYKNITWFALINAPYKEQDNDTYDIPENLIKFVASPAYSTARGIIYSRTAHSFLINYILPLTDSNQLFQHYKALQQKRTVNQ